MAAEEKIVDRVRKLLELAKHRNGDVNESASAAKAAQKLMDKNNITEAMIAVQAADGETEEADTERVEKGALHTHSANNMPTWKIDLAGAVARANQCRILIGRNYIRVVGRPSDGDKARYLFSFVSEEIDRLTKTEARLLGSPGRTYLNNFRHGAVEAVSARLHEAGSEARAEARQQADAQDTMGTGAALVVVNKAIERIDRNRKQADAWVKRNARGTRRRSGSSYDSSGREAGNRAGRSIDIGGQRAAIGRGAVRQLR